MDWRSLAILFMLGAGIHSRHILSTTTTTTDNEKIAQSTETDFLPRMIELLKQNWKRVQTFFDERNAEFKGMSDIEIIRNRELGIPEGRVEKRKLESDRTEMKQQAGTSSVSKSNSIKSTVGESKRKGSLFIYERLPGHSICMNNRTLNECNAESLFVSRNAKKVIKRIESPYNPPYNKYHVENIVSPGESTVIPMEIIDFMEELLTKYSCTRISIEWVKLDNNFLERLSNAMNGNEATSLVFHEVLIDESLDMEKFSEFLRTITLNKLEICLKEQVLPLNLGEFLRVFNESFLSSLKSDSKGFRPNFKLLLETENIAKISYFWCPSNVFLPVICPFEFLHIPSLNLQPDIFIELIVMRLTSDEFKSDWNFSSTAAISSFEEHLLKIDSSKYSVEHYFGTDEGESWCCVRKIDFKFRCYATFEKISPELLSLTMSFFDDPNM